LPRVRKFHNGETNGDQASLKLPPARDEHLNIAALEQWLWDAACIIRGATDAPKFKDFILPLVFYKRLSDVYDDEVDGLSAQFGDRATAIEVIAEDHADALRSGRPPIVRFYVPDGYSWQSIRNHGADGKLGEFVTEAMREVARLNPDLQGVLDIQDFNERQAGERTLGDDRLAALIEVISRHRLGLKNTEPDVLGRAYEYLLRKFAEGQGQSAGEFYTPKEVGWLMADLLDPRPLTTIHDPTCGSGGLLLKPRLRFEQRHPTLKSQAPRLYGQELNPTTFAIAKMNMFLHDFTDAVIAIGDTLRAPRFLAEGAGLQRFDYVIANPMWNQKHYGPEFYDNDTLDRFNAGQPPANTADWGWVQHMLAALNETGRAAIVLDTGAVSRGSGSKSNDKEKKIRAALVEADVIEGVVLLPENLFYNTTAPGIVLLLNRAKPAERKGQFILLNASQYFRKEKPKNVLTDEGIAAVAGAYHAWETRPKLSKVVTLADVRKADYNLSPSQFVEVGDRAIHRDLTEILTDLRAAREERERADAALAEVLGKLGLEV
jgi:type I restriction enzyme M protein